MTVPRVELGALVTSRLAGESSQLGEDVPPGTGATVRSALSVRE